MKRIFCILFSFFILNGCVVHQPISSNVKKIGIISSFGNTMSYGRAGIPIVFNNIYDVDVSNWNIDQFTSSQLKQRLTRDGYDVTVVTAPENSFSCKRIFNNIQLILFPDKNISDKLRDVIGTGYPDIDTWILLTETADQVPCQLVHSLSALREVSLVPSSNPRRDLGVSIAIDIVDGHSFERISESALGYNAEGPRQKFTGFPSVSASDYPDNWSSIDNIKRESISEHFKNIIDEQINATIEALHL